MNQQRIAVKRIIDTAVILVFSPLALTLASLTAVAIRATMGSPVLFRQVRIGRSEKPFELLKFRTMRDAVGPDGRPLEDRERLTAVGRFLRKTSLDELPQLWNILRGDMALVGPRPLLPEYLPFYREKEKARHSVRPGITGAAQASGRNSLLWDDRLRIDAEYAREVSLLEDLRILACTVIGVLRRDGVSVVAGDTGEPLHVVRSYPSDGGRVMRRLETVDAAVRVTWFADERVRRTMNVPRDITVDGTTEWIMRSRQDRGHRDYVLVNEADGAVVAMMGTRRAGEEPTVEIYLLVDPDQQRRGIGSSAMKTLMKFLRAQRDLSGAWLTVAPENAPAIRLYRKFGFTETDPENIPADPSRIRMSTNWEETDVE